VTWSRVQNVPAAEGDKRQSGKRKESKTELQSKMQASAQKMSAGWGTEGRLSSAVAAIEEIPMRISEDMQRAASYVVDNMQSEVAAVSKQILGAASGSHSSSSSQPGGQVSRRNTEKVIKNLEVIPTMVQNLLEARVEKARSKVRNRVHGMIQNLSAIKEENWEDHEGLVSQMRLISEEVEQIAGEAVRAAAQECHAHAVKQLDSALTALREHEEKRNEAGTAPVRQRWSDIADPASGSVAGKMMTHDPEFWAKAVPERENWTKDSMEQVAAVVQDKDYIPQSFTNQVVADELLRARIRSGGGKRHGASMTASAIQSARGSAAAAASSALVCNPGSQGHPELCLRPCLYFAQGNCTNGN